MNRVFLRPAKLILLWSVCIAPLTGARAHIASSAPDTATARLPAFSNVADSLLSAGNASEALKAYHQALKYYRHANSTTDIARVIANIGRAHGRIIVEDQNWVPEFRQETERKEIYYRISKISDRRRDTLVAQIDGGTLDGISVGGKGEVSPVNTKDVPTRNEWSLAKAEVVQAGQNTSTVVLSREEKASGLSDVREGDIVILPVQVPKREYRSIFFSLSALRIWFLDLSRDTLYHPRQILYDDGQQLESDILESMANDVRQTVPALQPYLKDNPSWGDTLTGGFFEGMSLMDALERCTSSDILSFLEFVKSFPAKYMGVNWKINETFATWVLNNTPLGDGSLLDPTVLLRLVSRPSFSPFVKESRAYILERGAVGSWNTAAESKAAAGRYDEADQIVDLAMKVADILKSDSSKALVLVSRGRVAEWEKKQDAAMACYTQAIALAPEGANGYFFRGRLSSALGRYDDAIKDMRRVESLVPNYAGAYGGEGWYLILQGKFSAARGPALKATELDTTNMAWTVNLGHTYLLEGDTATARKHYAASLRRIRSAAEFEEGPIADFELFIKNGWKTDLAKLMMEWMQSEYDAAYRYDVTSLEHWQEGKNHLAQGEFAEAGERFEKSYQAEMKSRDPKEVWIMVEAEYAGSAFMKSAQYSRSLKSYETALAYSRNPVNGGSPSSYLRNISEVYSALGDGVKSREYELKAVELDRTLSAIGTTNNLYLLAIGIDNRFTGRAGGDSADASAIVDVFNQKSKGVFQETMITLAVNAGATKDSVESALGSVAKRSKPGDTFVLFFAGPTFSDASGFYLKPFTSVRRKEDTSSTAGAISAWQLRTWLSKIPARRQLVVLDAPATSFIADYVSRSAREESYFEGTGRNLTILCPAESPEASGDQSLSLFARVLVEGLQGKAAVGSHDTIITVKELDAFLTRTLSQSDFEVQSYTRGKDFPVAYVRKKTAASGDRTPPRVRIIEPAAMRGTMLVSDEKTLTVKGKAEAQGGIYQVLVNDVEANVLPDGSFSTEVKLAFGDNMIRVQASDTKDNIAIDTFYVKREGTSQSQTRQTGRQGKDYALLIATNDYDEWDHLTNPLFDATTLAATLKGVYGFDTTVVSNPTLEGLVLKLRDFRKLEYSDEDQLFIFIAGHGFYDPDMKDGYLVAKDSRKKDEARRSYLGYSELVNGLDNIPCKHIFVVLDACFGGSFDKRDPLRSRGEGAIYGTRPKEEIFKEKLKITSRLFMTSKRMNYVPNGEPGHHSPFASMLLKALEEGGRTDGYLTFHKIIPYIENAKSMPRYGDFGKNQSSSDFFFDMQANVSAKGKAPEGHAFKQAGLGGGN